VATKSALKVRRCPSSLFPLYAASVGELNLLEPHFLDGDLGYVFDVDLILGARVISFYVVTYIDVGFALCSSPSILSFLGVNGFRVWGFIFVALP